MSPAGQGPALAATILGAGSLGTALAASLWRPGRRLTLWTVEEDVADSLRTYRENVKYLPGIKVPKEVGVEMDPGAALQGAGIVIFAVPSHAVREVARRTGPLLPADAIVVSAAKGLERETLLRMSEVMTQELPQGLGSRIVVIAGPSLAPEIGEGVPTGVDVASADPDLARAVRAALAMKRFRFKIRRDVAGVEAGGTFKNLYAIGAGICDGLALGHNTKASLMTKALAEMVLLARSMGGKASTIYGLSGLGDLIATAGSPRSRNRTLGEHLGRGHKVAEITRGMVSVTEGVDAAHCAHELGVRHKLRIPVAETIYRILNGDEKADHMVKVCLP
ncbi:MAG TPA: NAD(P)H-dependent glycerol-3-phosphate dehydrogenase [Candidatus Polarisedimenticolia bacterium]|jgi:glycerol-3-phosphate dehydrogenase (NAD(P)+)